MQFDISSLIPVLPETFLLTMACVVLVVDLFLKEEQRIMSYALSQVTLLAAIPLTLLVGGGETQVVFDGSYIRDAMGDLLKVAIYVVTIGAFLYAKDYLRDHGLFKGEYYVLGLFAVLGMMVMVSANSFLTVYLGLELLSLSLYAMVAFDRDSKTGSEAAMKYFVLGAIASGMLLYGISMIYGATGSIGFEAVAEALSESGRGNMVLVFGLVFVVIGLAFKLGAVPFHMWLPDVYHGAPTAVTLFLSSTPKIAAFALAMRILVNGMEPMHADWQSMLVILAVLSMALGNVIAIAQTNIKRMLAYSTISHVGFILLGILAGTAKGYSASMFYTIVYALMALGGFGIVLLLSRKGFEAENLDDYKGLHQRSPWYAGMMLLLMFSMAGVPPTVGFFA
jgi:NADH-quinone oxidoreductase subunit N